jgi:hypothetical protein
MRNRLKILILALGGAMVFGLSSLFGAGAEEKLHVGDPAPSVVLKLDDGTELATGKPGPAIVLYFYPKDDTPG